MSAVAWPVGDLYLRCPTPEYGQAFDLLAMDLDHQDGPALAVLSSALHAVELLKRCPGPLHLCGTGDFEAAAFIASAQGWSWGPLAAADLAGEGPSFASMLWAEPEADSVDRVAAQLRRRAGQGASLRAIASAPLRRFLPAWQTAPLPAKRPVAAGGLLKALKARGWQVEGIIAFHGPRSILWSLLARAATGVGRPEWEDRCLLTMRTRYREPGWLWPLAPVALIHARPA